MHADLILIILAAAVVLVVVYRGLAWVYLPPRNLPDPDALRVETPEYDPPVRRLRDTLGRTAEGSERRAGELSSDDDPTELCQECLGPDGIHCDGTDRYCDCPCGWGPGWDQEGTEDDDWADQLHAINQLGKFGDLTRPVAHMTHYEVEALIVQLGVPEWVPDRYRVAA